MARIYKDEVVRSKFTRGKHRWGRKVNEIVLHGTAGGSTLNFVRNATGTRAHRYRHNVGLFHYLIQRDGDIWEIIDPDRWVYHSQRSSKDSHTIGIELVNLDYGNRGDYTDKQYDSLDYLIFGHLMEEYPKISIIMSHTRSYQKYVGGNRRLPCPGPGFEWDILEKSMDSRGYSYDHHPAYESYWNIAK